MSDTPLSTIINEIVSGRGLSMSEAGRRVPARRGSRPTWGSTVWRWVCRGYKLPDGSIIKLEAAKMAGRWLTSEAALARFIAAVTAASTATTARIGIQRRRWDFEAPVWRYVLRARKAVVWMNPQSRI